MSSALFYLILFSPLLVAFWLANLADRERHQDKSGQMFAGMAYFLLGLLWAGLAIGGIAVNLLGIIVAREPLSPDILDAYAQMGMSAESIEQIAANLPQIGQALWLPSLFGFLLLLPPLRRLASRWLDIDPASTVHALALSLTMLVLVNLWMTLAFGLGNLADLAELGGPMSTTAVAQAAWTQAILFSLLAMFGVGWLARRSLGAALARLDVTLPSPRSLLVGAGIGIALVAALIPLEYLTSVTGLGFDEEVERLSEQIIGPLTGSLFGILTLGLAAGLGEEMLLRGALQPRFGLIFTSIIFALLHSQYGLTLSTLIVFLIGLVFGVVRMRHNTTTAMVSHAVYNMAIGLLVFLDFWPEW